MNQAAEVQAILTATRQTIGECRAAMLKAVISRDTYPARDLSL